MTPWRTFESMKRISLCWPSGNAETSRWTTSAAPGVCSVAMHEVPRLGGGQRRVDRVAVAHLADADHVGVLPQHVSQGGREVAGRR